MWGATLQRISRQLPIVEFQSTLPVWGATSVHTAVYDSLRNFNPRSPCGERQAVYRERKIILKNFNPRSPCGERHQKYILNKSSNTFQSTLPVWGATCGLMTIGFCLRPFQSTLPVWGATLSTSHQTATLQFQSTLPVWGATAALPLAHVHALYFNPRSPCGERPAIVTHCFQGRCVFQSTLPVWGATDAFPGIDFLQSISIHAPRVGSDFDKKYYSACNPKFQSTLPVWGATKKQEK